ncbi:SRPBCC family protein [Mycolicibacterium grossiae]|uniref:Dimethyladenosine transferase n=1 Tax=Mycolicibacterium grossiae TaxID=1552759 RepID=A0A1E8Q3M1_9MYCO|nr:SRPBCC family protein [Mycolicibacterium grossiae]OFJ52659.1 dimethyladenosine transferase [Mycolicibacterium grossiae]QEM47350.1 dimethyladenosine transferase [Mycolicibacterium grossiae]
MTVSTLKTEDTGPRRVSRSVQVAAPVAEVFALIADPHRHHDLDGSGTVRDVDVKGPHRLKEGDRFTVGMTQYGVPYKITSTATAVEENHVVEWQHPLGHKWRWEFAEVSPGTTKVTETFDYSTAKLPFVIELTGYQKKNADGIESTLTALAQRFETR